MSGYGSVSSSSAEAAARDAADSTARRWSLLIAAAVVQTISGGVYAAGAWQTALRDALGTDTSGVQLVGACSFAGSAVAFVGGRCFDRFGPRATCALGGVLCAGGFALVLLAIVLGGGAAGGGALTLAGGGMLCVGFSSVSLLDNVVSMAASLRFAQVAAVAVALPPLSLGGLLHFHRTERGGVVVAVAVAVPSLPSSVVRAIFIALSAASSSPSSPPPSQFRNKERR